MKRESGIQNPESREDGSPLYTLPGGGAGWGSFRPDSEFGIQDSSND